MRLIENLDEITKPFKNGVITIGNFDGVHIGHQALFREVMTRAREIGGTSMAMTFEPHPLRFLKTRTPPPLITLSDQKLELLENLGLDILIRVPFTSRFASITAKQFVEEILAARLGVRIMVVGPDYSFGRNREGNVLRLQELSRPLGVSVIVAPWVIAVGPEGSRASSTRIRELIQEGRVEEAGLLLGRPFQIRGLVERGLDRGGKLLGFPTANVGLTGDLVPQAGVYVVAVTWRGKRLLGVANIGFSPTFTEHRFTLEVHILDFSQDLYGEKIEVNFLRRLRGEIKFPNVDALVAQIKKDVEEARNTPIS